MEGKKVGELESALDELDTNIRCACKKLNSLSLDIFFARETLNSLVDDMVIVANLIASDTTSRSGEEEEE